MKKFVTTDMIRYQLANLRQLTFEVTDACNLNCKYCAYGEFYNDYDERENKMMSVSAAIKIIDYLVEFWNSEQNMSAKRNVYISFYGGEPLMNMPFIESVVEYVESLHCKYRNFTFSMTTNAVLLERYMDFLVKHDFNLLISLDGNEYNNSYRVNMTGTPAYPIVISNVDKLCRKNPEYFERKVNFNAVLHNRNSIGEIYDFFKNRYNKIASIGELNNMGIRPDKVKLFQETYRNSQESLHDSENYEKIEQEMFIKSATYQTVTNFIHQYSGFVFRNYTDLLLGKQKKTIPTGTCIPFGRRMFITVNGKIMPCERIGQQFALGQVTAEAGVELDVEMIADKYNAYFAKLENQCSKCYRRESCIQCIFNLQDLEGTPICHGFMNEQEFEVYKSGQMDFLRKHPEEYYRIMENVVVD